MPAFLLSHFRGLSRATIMLACAMIALTIIQATSVGDTSDALPPAKPASYGAVLVGLLVLIELQYRERRGAEQAGFINRVTGLPNRQYFDVAIQMEFAAAERGRGMALVMFDVDNLDSINTRFGRPAGEVVINTLAKLVAQNTRKENLAAHFDAGRFVAALREADVPGAEVFAQRVLDRLRETAFPWGRATASAGVAAYEPGMGSHEILIGAADRAVAQAKAGGRDVVAVAPGKAEREEVARRVTAAIRSGTPVTHPARRLLYLVDDDASVRSAVKGMLVRMGYDVWDTDDPARAIARYTNAATSERPAAIVADVIMPVMTGPRMVEQIVALNPDVRVVYISGYAQGEITWSGAPGAVVATLAKPFGSEEMTAALAKVLGDDTPAGPEARGDP
jgi:diguanylate cyclase (GGDEF)-like protein